MHPSVIFSTPTTSTESPCHNPVAAQNAQRVRTVSENGLPTSSPPHMGRRPCSNLEKANNFTQEEMEKDGETQGSLYAPNAESLFDDYGRHCNRPSPSTSTFDSSNLSDDSPSHTRRHQFYRSKSVSFIPTNPKWRTRFKRRRQELALASVPMTSKEIRNSLLACAASTSGDFSSELLEVRRRNTELSASLSDVQAELEALKLSIQVEKDGEVDYVPGTITGAVQDLYKAQKEWQTTMMSRLQLNETVQEENMRKVAARLGGAAEAPDVLGDVHKLTAEKNAALNTLAVTKEKLDNLRICYSLQKSLLTNPETPSTSTWSGPRPIWNPLDPTPSFSGAPKTSEPYLGPPVDPGDLIMDDVAELLLQPRSAGDVEAKCQRLERLVAVLRRKVLTS